MKRSIFIFNVVSSRRYYGGFMIRRRSLASAISSCKRAILKKGVKTEKLKRLEFTVRCTDSQWLLTSALLNSLGLVPSSGMTEAYIKACHQEYYNKWQSDVCFRILVEDREEELRNYMRNYGAHRRYVKVDNDNNNLFLCVQNR